LGIGSIANGGFRRRGLALALVDGEIDASLILLRLKDGSKR